MDQESLFPNCQDVLLSTELSRNRINHVQSLFGFKATQRILCFALYVLGAKRSAIGRALNIPTETAKSMIKAVLKNGPNALQDRRSASPLPEKNVQEHIPITLKDHADSLEIHFGGNGPPLSLSWNDPLQVKIVLLSLVHSGLLPKKVAAKALGITPSHMSTLTKRFREQGAVSLLDQRQGQKQDYRVSPEVKGELIQQFTLDVVISGRTSSQKMSSELKQRSGLEVPARTIRHHMNLLGLTGIKKSLPQLVAAVKKTSSTCSS